MIGRRHSLRENVVLMRPVRFEVYAREDGSRHFRADLESTGVYWRPVFLGKERRHAVVGEETRGSEADGAAASAARNWGVFPGLTAARGLLDPNVKTQIEVMDAEPVEWHLDDRTGMHPWCNPDADDLLAFDQALLAA
jgi:hypothetical protein